MAVPVLNLNLVPRPTWWRHHHETLGWSILGLGMAALLAVGGLSLKAYYDARKEGKQTITLTNQAIQASRKEARMVEEVRAIDVAAEQPRWRLAEKVLSERSLPWSRITAELERSSVQDVRFKSIQRVKPRAGLGVQVKLKLECRTRESEVRFIEHVQRNPFFTGVVFERENNRQSGGMEVELTLPVNPTPPPFTPLPLYGPDPNKPDEVLEDTPPPAKPNNPPSPQFRPKPAQPPVATPPPSLASQAGAPRPERERTVGRQRPHDGSAPAATDRPRQFAPRERREIR